MSETLNMFIQAYQKALVDIGFLVEDEGIILKPETITIVAEIEENNRRNAIERALENGDRETFMALTSKKPLN